MKRIFSLLVVAGSVPSLVTLAVPSQASSKPHAREQTLYRESAPGDAYFGRLKMSYLTINNVFKDQNVRAGEHSVDPDIINKLKDADESLQAWVKAYPRDPQLSRSYFLAVAVYTKVWTKQYQEKAWQYMHVIVNRFPQSYFGKQVKKDLAIGFTEHYFADALPCPLTGATAAAATPPLQTATEKPVTNQPKVDIVASPCAAPATPAAATASASANPALVPIPVKSGAVEATPLPSPASTRGS